MYRDVCCKHIHAVEISLKIRKKVEQATIIKEISVDCCKFCSSDRITKKGIKKTKHGDFQQFRCKDCGRRFIQNFGFERMRATPQAITITMNLYFNGESTRGAARSIRIVKLDRLAAQRPEDVNPLPRTACACRVPLPPPLTVSRIWARGS